MKTASLMAGATALAFTFPALAQAQLAPLTPLTAERQKLVEQFFRKPSSDTDRLIGYLTAMLKTYPDKADKTQDPHSLLLSPDQNEHMLGYTCMNVMLANVSPGNLNMDNLATRNPAALKKRLDKATLMFNEANRVCGFETRMDPISPAHPDFLPQTKKPKVEPPAPAPEETPAPQRRNGEVFTAGLSYRPYGLT